MEIAEANGELDIEEIIKAARKVATTRSKDWILKQIKGAGSDKKKTSDERDDSRTTDTTQGSEEPPPEAKKQQRNTSRGAKKGDKREAGEPTEAATPGPSKKAKTSNGEQISIIVQECLKSMTPLWFVKPGGGGGQEAKGPGDPESREGPPPRRSKGKSSLTTRAEATPERSLSPDSGGEETAP
ncbi:hypothetical protein NDU88_000458 [Pleurodeles waltl]|uniref:Uncharacterized protein n=1 Tax=Pleurodeles waltl TaxID=8319 RepID=A0AAV7VTI7_PLEWA|nr:hypothetical protein NDU88_000458 [Pleurodeles waltl]